MSKTEAPLDTIAQYIPKAAVPLVINFLNQYQVHLTVTRERKSILGDYRHPTRFKTHRISVNGNLNKYSFLITLVHELAHLLTFSQFGNRVDAHGREWKALYAMLLKDFLTADIFPHELLQTLKKSLHDLPASSCADENLMRQLRKYDVGNNGLVLVEQVTEGVIFDSGKGRLFRRGPKLRKRYQCVEISTGKVYLFSPVYEVRLIAKETAG